MDQPPPTHRRFRFGLRTLLTVVTLAAVGAWSYWILLPWWQAYGEQRRFEDAVNLLKIGNSLDLEYRHIPFESANCFTMTCEERTSDFNALFGFSVYFLRNASYFVVYSYPKDVVETDKVSQWPCTRVQVFRSPPVPNGYQRQSTADSGLKWAPPGFIPEDSIYAYQSDFLNFFNSKGDQVENYGIPCELIYSDPPAKAVAK